MNNTVGKEDIEKAANEKYTPLLNKSDAMWNANQLVQHCRNSFVAGGMFVLEAAPSSTEAPVSVEGAAKTKLDIAEAELSGEELEFFGDQLGNLFDCMNEWAKIVVGDKDIELKLMDEREVLWSNKHAMLNEQLLSANKEVEELKRKVEIYRSETDSCRKFVVENKDVGYPTQPLWDAVHDKLTDLKSENIKLRFDKLKLQSDLEYWKARCEAAEELIKVLDIPKNKAGTANQQWELFGNRNDKWQQLKLQPPEQRIIEGL